MYSPKRRFRLFRSPAFQSFRPSSIAGLNVWLDATDVTGTGTNPANGTIVATWKDKSGLGNDATSVGTPTLASTGVNGKAGVLLNGTSMSFGGSVSNTGTVVTAFAVATLNSGAAEPYARLLSMPAATGDDFTATNIAIPFLRNFESPQGIGAYRNGSYRATQALPAYDVPFYGSSVFDGATSTVYVNGVVGAYSTASTGSFGIASYNVGSQRNTLDWWKGYVSEVLIYNAALSTPNRQAVESYLATKWGI